MDRAASHALALWILLAFFCFRVLAQLGVAAFPEIGVLPAFDRWASGALPYPALVVVQLLIIVVYAAIARRIGAGRSKPRRSLGRFLVAFGGIYFSAMLARLVLGGTAFRGHWWLDRPLPSFFHLVLAGFLLVAAHFHLGGPAENDASTEPILE